jgi:tRNA G18 (ribose-2'-O)-methylase SpoU
VARLAVQRINEPGDPRLADYAHVGDAAWLRAHGLFVAEGRLVVERLVETARFRIRSVVLTPAAFEALAGRLAAVPAPVYLASRDVLEALTGFDFHRGCLALAERPAPADAPWSAGGSLLGIEGVANPDNIGGLFRVAEAFGAGGVLLDPSCADPLYRKSIRTSMGSVLRLPFERPTPWIEALEAIRAKGFRLVTLTPHLSGTPIDDYSKSMPSGERLVLIVGAEGPGASEALLELSDHLLRIPIAEPLDSLNVVVAAGVALWALRKAFSPALS